jgi:hypothetical protein
MISVKNVAGLKPFESVDSPTERKTHQTLITSPGSKEKDLQ